MVINQYEIYWVNLDPSVGSEMKKLSPCLVLSPNETNEFLNTIIIAPITSTSKKYPTRISIEIEAKMGYICLDQIKTIDKRERVKTKITELSKIKIKEVKKVLKEFLID